MTKRLLCLLLATVLCLALLSSAFAEDAAEERVVLTIGELHDRSADRIDGENQLGMWQYLEDQLGVELQVILMTQEEYAAGLASGDLPDIVVTNNNLSTILESGAALNIDPYLEEYCPNFLQGDLLLTYQVYKQLLAEETDGFYFFPCRVGAGDPFGTATNARGYIVRWDYYKELGYPPIENEDDYLNVLLQMHERHPYTEEGYPTYLYGGDSFTGYDTAFRAELSVNYWAAYEYQNNIFTNEISDGYTDPAHSKWWTNKAWHNRLYRAGKDDGSYDLEYFTQTKAQYDLKCRRGQYLGLQSVNNVLYNDRVKTDPDTLTGYNLVPSAGTNFYTNFYQLLGNGSAYMWFISANSPHWKQALRLFNYMCDPDFLRQVCAGEKGVTWDYDADGVPRMTEYGQKQMDEFRFGTYGPDNYFYVWGYFDSLPNNWPLLRKTVLHPDGYPLDFANTREYLAENITNNISKDICEHYGVQLPTDAHYQAGCLDFRNDCGEAISSAISSLDREQVHTISEASAILDEALVELVLAESDEEYLAIQEETIQKIIDLGEPEVFRAYQEKWDAAAAIIVPLVYEAQKAKGVELYTPEQYERFS